MLSICGVVCSIDVKTLITRIKNVKNAFMKNKKRKNVFYIWFVEVLVSVFLALYVFSVYACPGFYTMLQFHW